MQDPVQKPGAKTRTRPLAHITGLHAPSRGRSVVFPRQKCYQPTGLSLSRSSHPLPVNHHESGARHAGEDQTARPILLVILTSLCAEGAPVLALDMCRLWQTWGLSPHVVTLVTEPTDLEAEFRRLEIPVHTLALSSTGRAKFPLLATGIHRLCRQLRPQAVLSMPLGWHAMMFMGARGAGVRNTAAHVGNYPPVDDPKALAKFRFLMQLGRGVTDRLICCSTYVQQAVHAHFDIPMRETQVIYNGVDVETLARRSALARSRVAGSTNRPFTIGMVARLEIHKDQPTLIRAVRTLKDAGLSVELRLIGEGSRRDEYERLVESLSVQANVKLLGMRRDLPEQLGELDAFVFSAKPDEGLGVALIEAMAARVPIIATDVGACREVLEGSAFGHLVPPADVGALADAIRRVATSGQQNGKMLDGASARAATVFSIESMARRYASCLGFQV